MALDILDPSIVGHRIQQRDLLHALRTGRLAHAYLFSGQDGIGKRRVAQALAQAVVCENPLEHAPCLSCRQCKMVRDGAHPDVQLFTDGISVEDMRESVLAWAARTPREGKAKVGILTQIEDLGAAAANAFLKILEEPPASTRWILVSGRAGAALGTIVSRCTELRFAPLQRSELDALLSGPLREKLYEALNARGETAFTDAERAFALECADGSPGRLLSTVQDNLFAALSAFEEMRARRTSPMEASERILTILTHRDDETQHALRRRLKLFVAQLQRHTLKGRTGGNTDTEKVQPRLQSIDRFFDLSDAIDENVNVKLLADNLSLCLFNLYAS